jgi:Uma2 family endonuclease
MEMAELLVAHQPIRRLKRAEYDLLVKHGVFGDERVELLFGTVVAMSPIDPAHNEAVARINQRLILALAGRAVVRCQSSFAASDDSEPEPDIYVTPLGDYWDDHPSRAFLVIEVARSSLAYDRDEKASLYSTSQVEEYWVVDQVNGVVEVRRDRHDGAWRTIASYRRGDRIAPLAFPDVEIEVSEVLPPP